MITTFVKRYQQAVAAVALNPTTLTALSVAQQGKFRYADIQVQTADVRVTFDNSTDPVAATTGQVWYTGKTYRVWGLTTFNNLKAIRDTTTSAVLVIDCWGEA